MAGSICGSLQMGSFWDIVNAFQERPPDLCVNLRTGDEFLAVLAYSET